MADDDQTGNGDQQQTDAGNGDTGGDQQQTDAGNNGDQQQQTDAGARNWMEDLPERHRGNPQLQRFASVEKLAQAFLDTRSDLSSRPRKGATVVPDERSTERERTEYRAAMQIPDDKDGYEISLQLPNDPAHPEYGYIRENPEHVAKFREVAHAAGLTKKQVEAVANLQVDILRDAVRSQVEAERAEQTKNADILERLYGADLTTKLELVKPLAPLFGKADDDGTDWFATLLRQEQFPGGLGNNALLKRLLINIGEKVRGDRFVADANQPAGGGAAGQPAGGANGFQYPTMAGGAKGPVQIAAGTR